MFKKSMGVLLCVVIFSLAACSEKLPIETNMSESVDEFSYTNQDEENVALDDLSGDWWIADFVFTNCTTVCLPMTSNMSKLQDDLKEEDISIDFVSFSVDPDYDQPDVLKEYGEEYDANFDNWNFLTGYEFDDIKKISIKSFRAPLKEPEYGSDQVTHDTRFFLVNPDGKVVKGYDGIKMESMDDIVEDMKKLNEQGLM